MTILGICTTEASSSLTASLAKTQCHNFVAPNWLQTDPIIKNFELIGSFDADFTDEGNYSQTGPICANFGMDWIIEPSRYPIRHGSEGEVEGILAPKFYLSGGDATTGIVADAYLTHFNICANFDLGYNNQHGGPEYDQEYPIICGDVGVEDLIRTEKIGFGQGTTIKPLGPFGTIFNGYGHNVEVDLFAYNICSDHYHSEYIQEYPHICANFGVDGELVVDPMSNGAGLVVDLHAAPAALISGDVLHGAGSHATIATTPVLSLLNIPFGAESDVEFTVPPLAIFYPRAHNGSEATSLLDVDRILPLNETPAGSSSSAFLVTLSPALLSPSGAHGGELSVDFTIVPAFGVIEGQHGASGSLNEITSPPLIAFAPNALHGINGENSTLSTSQNFSVLAENGIQASSTIAYVAEFEGRSHFGSEAESELKISVVHKFDSDAHHGIEIANSLSVTYSFILKSHNGIEAISELEVPAGKELEADATHGIASTADELIESDFVFNALFGSSAEVVYLQSDARFVPNGAHGQAGLVSLQPTAHLSPTGDHGIQIVTDLSSLPGVEFELTATHGAYTDADFVVPFQAFMVPLIINFGQTCYDGLGGVGGINFCLTGEDQTSVMSDLIADAPTDYYLDMDFACDPDDRIWSVCDKGGMTFDTELRCNPRFECVASHGSSAHMYIPLKVEPLFQSGVSVERLYHWEYYGIVTEPVFELETIQSGATGTTYDTDEEVKIYHGIAANVELTEQPYTLGHHGAEVKFTLGTAPAYYKGANKSFEHGSSVSFTMEQEYDAYMCKGYILPNGNNATVDFGVIDEQICKSTTAQHGAHASVDTLWTLSHMSVVYTEEEKLEAELAEERIWSVTFGHGHTIEVELEKEIKGVCGFGSIASCTMYRPKYTAEHGSIMANLSLVVPGPGIEFQTDPDTCIPNQHIFLDEHGDPDETATNLSVTVESLPYVGKVNARCVAVIPDESTGE